MESMEQEMNRPAQGQMPEGHYIGYVRLRAGDVDVHDRWKLSSVFGHVMEVANDQCTELGCGWRALMTQYGYCFVIVRMDIVMRRYPGSGETVRIETWAQSRLRPVFTRYFRLCSESGEEIGHAVSQWVLFDVHARTVVKPQTCALIQVPDTSSLTPPMAMPKSSNLEIAPPDRDESLTETASYTPLYNDFDYNGHVNNARYIEWIFNALPLDMLAGDALCQVEELDVRYEHKIDLEAFLHAEEAQRALQIRRTVDREHTRFTVAGMSADGTVHFEGRGTLRRTGG